MILITNTIATNENDVNYRRVPYTSTSPTTQDTKLGPKKNSAFFSIGLVENFYYVSISMLSSLLLTYFILLAY
jgi:hypothetical protein